MSQLGLVVVHPFDRYETGATITEEGEVSRALAQYPAHVVRSLVPDEKAPEKDDELPLVLPPPPAIKA